ncbi:MAG: diacylglycerol kinase [Candidatus Omnitrophota bacterium]
MRDKQNIIQSFNCAIEGFIYVMKTQRNMRIHFLAAVAIILFAIYLNFSKTDILLLCAAITFVLLSEMLNTSIELAVDLVSDGHHPLARISKDVAAGAVFIASINAVVTGYLLFSRRLPFPLESGILKIKHSPWHMTFICLILVFAIVVMAKVLVNKGTPLRGGMPSGHSAMAFSMWAIISIVTENGLIAVLTFVMAMLIARSRITDKIHSFWEVAAGALVGVLMTILVFQLLG